MKITVNQFAGMAPKIDPVALADDLAQVAENVSFEAGVVTGEMASVTASAFGELPRPVRAIAAPPTIDARFGFTYNTRSAAFASMLAPRDVWGRVYFLRPRGGKLIPSYTTADHYTQGAVTIDPTAFDLGMPRPIAPPTIAGMAIDYPEVEPPPTSGESTPYTPPAISAEVDLALRIMLVAGTTLDAAAYTDIRALLADSEAMSKVVGSVTAMRGALSSKIVCYLFVESPVAMARVADDWSGSAEFVRSELAVGMMVESAPAVAAMFAGFAGRNALLGSSTAMTAVASSETAMRAVAASTVAMEGIITSVVAIKAVAASVVAMRAILAVPAALAIFSSSHIAMDEYAKAGTANSVIVGKEPLVEAPEPPELDKVRTAYVYTLVDEYGHEGPPSDPSGTVEVPFGAPWRVDLSFVPQSVAANMGGGYRRLYRATFDGSTSEFQFVADVPFAQLTWEDHLPLGQEGEALVSMDWVPPPPLDSLEVVGGSFLAGFDGNLLCYSAYMLPHAWPESHRFPLPYAIVAIKSTLGGLFIATNGSPFWASGADPESATPVNLGRNFPCVSAHSVVDMGGSVIYATHDGLVVADATGVQLATAPYIDRLAWLRDFSPENITAFCHEGEYYFSVGDSWWVFSTAEGRGLRKTTLGGISGSEVRQVFYDSPRDTTVILTTGGTLRDVVSAQTGGDFRWRSKRFRISPTHFSTGQVVASKYPVTFRVACDDLVHEYTVSSEHPIRLRSLGLRNNWWMEVEAPAATRVSSMSIAQSPSELIYG